ncbi:hypothetical protein ACVWYK_001902 [Bradyrhizobium sp. USDA 4470]
MAKLGAICDRRIHHRQGEFPGMNDRGRLGRSDAPCDDDALAQPVEHGRRIPARVAIGRNIAAIRAHRPMAPIACNLFRQLRVKREAATCQRIERRAGAPVPREEAASLARCRGCDVGSLNHDDVDPATTQEVGRASPDHAAAANHNAHGFDIDDSSLNDDAIRTIRRRRGPAAPLTVVTDDAASFAHGCSARAGGDPFVSCSTGPQFGPRQALTSPLLLRRSFCTKGRSQWCKVSSH